MDVRQRANEIERALAAEGIEGVVVEQRGDTLTLSGRVDTPNARAAAEEIAARFAPPNTTIDNSLEVEPTMPDRAEDLAAGFSRPGASAESIGEILDEGGELDPDFTDQVTTTDAANVIGAPDRSDDPGSDGDENYFPPTDPVVKPGERGSLEVVGGFGGTSMDAEEVAPSSDTKRGDEAIAEAVRRELHEDAATTDLDLDVLVRNGVVHIRGRVNDLEDAENAEDVASRVPGVREVVDETEIEAL